MSTVFEGVSRESYPGDSLTEQGVEWVNRLAASILDERYPEQTPWVPVPGGEGNGEWNRLVRGNAYGVPTDKQSEEIFDLLASIPQSYALPDGCWEK